MVDIPDEIEEMEQIAKDVERWAENQSHNMSLSATDYCLSVMTLLKPVLPIVAWLQRIDEPGAAQWLTDEQNGVLQFAEFVRQAKDAGQKFDDVMDNGDNAELASALTMVMDCTQTQATILAETLRHIAKVLKENWAAKIETGQKITLVTESPNMRTQRKLHRETDIAVILDKQPSIKIDALAKELKVSKSTISRSKVWQQHKAKPPKKQFPNSVSSPEYE